MTMSPVTVGVEVGGAESPCNLELVEVRSVDLVEGIYFEPMTSAV